MLSADENKLVTEIEENKPCGNLLRQFWQPVALKEEIDPPREAKAVKIMGEDLVLFRDDNRNYGLIDRRCPHRGADLHFGRLEDGGIRCPFHGWLFNINGKCMEQPAEPAESKFYTKIKIKSYPCKEINGIIFTYMGKGNPPSLPNFDCFIAPNSHSFAFKGYLECNWLQAVEVGIDPSHASFLHRYLENHDPDYGLQFGGNSGDSEMAMTAVLRDYVSPDIHIETTKFGLRLITTRNLNKKDIHVRVTNMVFPNLIVIPMTNDMCIFQWHIPIDDTHSWWYAIFTDFKNQVDKNAMREQRLDLYSLPDYKPKINKATNYGYDPEEQRTKTFTGMGMDINVHDQWAVESPGPIYDRTQEHLGSADKGITAFRKSLINSIKLVAAGKSTPFNFGVKETPKLYGPMAIDTIVSVEDWQNSWKTQDRKKRKLSNWADVDAI